MKADLWKRIDELFAAAQAQPAGERAAFLDHVCEGDQELRAELESLLKAATADKSFLEHPPAAPSDRPALKAGDKLGAFEIVERIGRGGMGEVYRARDSRLKRDVAIKVLPPDFADDPGRLRRFEHEARAASALQHPNIVSVFDIGSTGGVSWMVTELVEGRSLREVLAKGAMPVRRAVALGAQIADGLAAAHAAGLVHRDLKAENVMLAPGDLVKILDFGIAKRAVRDAGDSTVTDTLTRTGEVVGTVTSMSPEQVEGKEVDHRSDIFSFGVLLYEMLSGKRPFTGDTHAAVMNAIVNQEPEDLPAAVPEAISEIAGRCLEKRPESRFQSAADLAYALRKAIPAHSQAETRRKRWPVAAALAVAASGLAAGGLWLGRRTAPAPPAFHGTMRRLTWDGGLTTSAVISADGKLVAYASDRDSGSNLDIYVQQVDGGGVVRLTRDPGDHDFPAFTPDGSQVAFDAGAAGIYEVPALGGEARLLVAGRSLPRFSPDGRFLLYAGGLVALRRSPVEIEEFYVQPVAGGKPALISRGCSDMSAPMWSPDSQQIVFTGYCSGTPGLWLADREGRGVRRMSAAAGLEQLPWASSQWLANPSRLLGYAWFGDASHLVEIPVLADGGTITGPTRTITFGPGVIGNASASSDGRTVFTSQDSTSTLWRLAVDAQGHAKGDPIEIPTGWSACLSPMVSKDGRNLAYVAVHMLHRQISSESEVRVMNLETGVVTPVARRSGYLDLPTFNTAGDRVTFNDFSKTTARIMEVGTRGGTEVEFPFSIGPGDWSSDGSFFLAPSGFPARNGVVAVNRRNLKPIAVLADPKRDLWQAHLSPDDRWVTFNAFNAVGDGHSRIYTAPFRMENVPLSEWIPLTDGATWDDKPRLSSDGRLLFFLSDRDGFRCIWRQRLAANMHPEGRAEPVYHFHTSRRSFLAIDINDVELTVGPGFLVFNPGEARGNIWMLDPRPEGAVR